MLRPGKSTQVPQFILDANPTCNIVVTQPRRIAAISISERVAFEQLQETSGGQIGYKVRLESNQNEKTQLLFMTPGVLLRQLQSDPWLQTYTHIIMDEVGLWRQKTLMIIVACVCTLFVRLNSCRPCVLLPDSRTRPISRISTCSSTRPASATARFTVNFDECNITNRSAG